MVDRKFPAIERKRQKKCSGKFSTNLRHVQMLINQKNAFFHLCYLQNFNIVIKRLSCFYYENIQSRASN